MEFDVAIIGCGPVGALAANLLGIKGLRTVVVEREKEPHPLPRAVHLDHEMMRLFQVAGVIDRVEPDMRSTQGNLHIGADSGVIRYMGTVGQPRPFGWSNDYFFFQPELEAHLRESLAAYPNVELRLGTNFDSLVQDDDGVTLSLSKEGQAETVRSRWVIACDGARSSVRKFLDIRLDDLDFEEPWLVVDVEVDGPVQFPPLTGVPEEANLQELSVMVCDPKRPMTVVPGRGNHRRWELMLLPGEDDIEMMQEQRVKELVGPWVKGVPHKIVRAATYRFHGLIAEKWQQGNVFLAGDAAHQTPPFFGQGMCHGMRDVANLVWKMALIKEHKADEALLETYQLERDSHVRKIISTVVGAGRYICMLDAEEAAARDAKMREAAKSTKVTSTAKIIPAIEDGVVSKGSDGAGDRFIQPWLETPEGRDLLDNVTGNNWRFFARDAEMASQAISIAAVNVPDLEITTINVSSLNDDGALSSWLDEHNANIVLVRPDFYVFGTADNSESLKALVTDLQCCLVSTVHKSLGKERLN